MRLQYFKVVTHAYQPQPHSPGLIITGLIPQLNIVPKGLRVLIAIFELLLSQRTNL